jgi:putative redox protein
MGIVAKRSGWNIDGMTCHVVKEMVADPVRRIGKLTAKITLPAGCNLDDSARRKLEAAAHTCPVKQSLHPEVAMEFEFIYP